MGKLCQVARRGWTFLINAVVSTMIEGLQSGAATQTVRSVRMKAWAPMLRDAATGSPLVVGDLGTLLRLLTGDLRRIVANAVVIILLFSVGVKLFWAKVFGKLVANLLFTKLTPADRAGRRLQVAGAWLGAEAGDTERCSFLITMVRDSAQKELERQIMERPSSPIRGAIRQFDAAHGARRPAGQPGKPREAWPLSPSSAPIVRRARPATETKIGFPPSRSGKSPTRSRKPAADPPCAEPIRRFAPAPRRTRRRPEPAPDLDPGVDDSGQAPPIAGLGGPTGSPQQPGSAPFGGTEHLSSPSATQEPKSDDPRPASEHQRDRRPNEHSAPGHPFQNEQNGDVIAPDEPELPMSDMETSDSEQTPNLLLLPISDTPPYGLLESSEEVDGLDRLGVDEPAFISDESARIDLTPIGHAEFGDDLSLKCLDDDSSLHEARPPGEYRKSITAGDDGTIDKQETPKPDDGFGAFGL
jgi:hypothetical protein